MGQEKLNEKVESSENPQTEEEIISYWTSERQQEAQPIPLPTIDAPAEEAPGNREEEFSTDEQLIVEPVGPEN